MHAGRISKLASKQVMRILDETQHVRVALLQVMQGHGLPLLATAFIGQHPRVTALIGPNMTKLRRFPEYVSTLYIDVPYHNPMHATQVVWAAHALLHSTRAMHVLPPLYVLALYVAAACHDVGHKCAPVPSLWTVCIQVNRPSIN